MVTNALEKVKQEKRDRKWQGRKAFIQDGPVRALRKR